MLRGENRQKTIFEEQIWDEDMGNFGARNIKYQYTEKKFPLPNLRMKKGNNTKKNPCLPPSSSSRDGLSLNLTQLMAQPYIFFAGPYPMLW